MRFIFGALILIASIVAVVVFFSKKRHQPFPPGSPYDITTGGHGRKKILIFSSRGGGGHISVANALFEYLGDDYTVGSTYIFSEVLGRFDPIARITLGKHKGEDLYNYMIRKKWHIPLNMVYDIGSILYNINKRKIEAVLEEYIKQHQPDLIVSVIPVINNLIYDVAKKLDVPFLLIPTDLDSSIAINSIYKPTYEKFYVASSYDDEAIKKKLNEALIPKEQISFVGFPVKKAFLDPHAEHKTRKDFNIPHDKPVILLLMGAQGSRELYSYSRQLAKLKTPVHLLIAIGKSENVRPALENINFPSHITYTILGFTNRIPELMSLADLIISKSGSVSVNEAIYSNLPILLDATSTIIRWEYLNHAFIKKHGFGDVIKRYSTVPTMIDSLLGDDQKLKKYTENLEQFKKPNAQEEIKALIRKILK